jgi:hypothetical protein
MTPRLIKSATVTLLQVFARRRCCSSGHTSKRHTSPDPKQEASTPDTPWAQPERLRAADHDGMGQAQRRRRQPHATRRPTTTRRAPSADAMRRPRTHRAAGQGSGSLRPQGRSHARPDEREPIGRAAEPGQADSVLAAVQSKSTVAVRSSATARVLFSGHVQVSMEAACSAGTPCAFKRPVARVLSAACVFSGGPACSAATACAFNGR